MSGFRIIRFFILRYLRLIFSEFTLSRDLSENANPKLLARLSNEHLFHAIHFAYRHYPMAETLSADEGRKEDIETQVTFSKEYGKEGLVSPGSLRTTDPLLRQFMGSRAIWGSKYVERVIEIGDLIRAHRRRARSSLGAILGSVAD